MVQRLKNRWVQLVVVAVVMAAVGAVVAQFAFPSGDGDSIVTAGDRVVLTSPLSTGAAGGGRGEFGAANEAVVFLEELPLTAAEAVAAGWKDPFLCDAGRGRTFQKAGEQDVPYLLMYNIDNDLLGMYMFSMVEVPQAPWVKMGDLVAGGRPVIEEEHWAMLVYFKDPTRACGAKTGGCGFNPYC